MTVDRARLLGALERLGVQGLGSVRPGDVPEVEVADPVYTLVLDTAVDTNAATLELGLNATTYQPDAFPGVVYGGDATVLAFGTGHVVVADADDRATAEDAVAAVVARLLDADLVGEGAVPAGGVKAHDLPAVEALPAAWTEGLTPEVETDDGTPDCPDCGTDLDGTENFCPSCGAALDDGGAGA